MLNSLLLYVYECYIGSYLHERMYDGCSVFTRFGNTCSSLFQMQIYAEISTSEEIALRYVSICRTVIWMEDNIIIYIVASQLPINRREYRYYYLFVWI